MKLNNKGFTLVEVISVILIIAILAGFVIPSVFGYFDTSKEKSEEIFVKEMARVIENYVALNGRNISYDMANPIAVEKCDPLLGDSSCVNVNAYRNETTNKITFNDLISEGLIQDGDIINPKTNMECSLDTEIVVYRDDDYVYCFMTTLDCVDAPNNKINTCLFE